MNHSIVIDFLRFIAILSVVFNHYFKEYFYNGYLGVDVFILISGYLIIGGLLVQKKNNNFSLITFYKKRFNRLMPAFIVASLFIYLISYTLLWESQFNFILKSLISSYFYFANVFFNYEVNYFTPTFNFIPTIHLWSLSLEEQFYIFIALIFFLLSYKSVLILLCFLFISSLLIFLFSSESNSSFYLLQYRVWQFLLGGAAFICASKFKFNNFFLSFFVFLCLLIILFSSFFNNHDHFLRVSVSALTFIILISINYSYESKWPTNSIFYILGRSSYSTYLYHQPFLLIATILFNSSFVSLLFFTVMSFLVGHLSYLYVESIAKNKIYNVKYVYFVLLFLLLIFLLHYISIRNDTDVDRQILTNDNCEYNSGICKLKISSSNKNVLLVGDSHSLVLSDVVQDSLNNTNVFFVYANGCLPFTSHLRDDHKKDYCSNFDNYLHSNLKQYDTIISANRWSRYFYGSYGGENKVNFISDVTEIFDIHLNALSLFSSDLHFVHQVPEHIINPSAFRHNQAMHKLSYDKHLSLKNEYLHFFGDNNTINLDDAFCDNEYCYSYDDNDFLLYYDEDHLNNFGASKAKYVFVKYFKDSSYE